MHRATTGAIPAVTAYWLCMLLSDKTLALRLEAAEGHAASQHAHARSRVSPASGADWLIQNGVYVIFDGPDSPATQTFGLGLEAPATATTLESIEQFFLSRHAPVHHEVCPFAGASALDLLCTRRYRPVELSSVLYAALPLAGPEARPSAVQIHCLDSHDLDLWTRISLEAWSADYPEFAPYMQELAVLTKLREDITCFLATWDGQPAAAASLMIDSGVALLAGAATLPTFRRRGLQSALVFERLAYAAKVDCDLAMVVTEVGSRSQHNAERQGFRIAYTRTKWQLQS